MTQLHYLGLIRILTKESIDTTLFKCVKFGATVYIWG